MDIQKSPIPTATQGADGKHIPKPDPLKKEFKALARALRNGKGQDRDPHGNLWGRSVFLIGAGCSMSAGYPSGEEVCLRLAVYAAQKIEGCDDEILSLKIDEPLDWAKARKTLDWVLEKLGSEPLLPGSDYGRIFDELAPEGAVQRDFFLRLFDKRIGPTGRGETNWAHSILAQLVANRYVGTVLTTNFDQLVLESLFRAGIVPVVADGMEALTRIDGKPRLPQVVHLHGSIQTYRIMNTSHATEKTAENAQATRALYAVLRDATAVVVVGYAGAELGVMSLLNNVFKDLRDTPVFWTTFDKEGSVSDLARALLTSVATGYGHLLPGQDADLFFARIARELGSEHVAVPPAMNDPIEALRSLTQISRPKTRYCIEGSGQDADFDRIHGEFDTFETMWKALSEAAETLQNGESAGVKSIQIARRFLAAGKYSDLKEELAKFCRNSTVVFDRAKRQGDKLESKTLETANALLKELDSIAEESEVGAIGQKQTDEITLWFGQSLLQASASGKQFSIDLLRWMSRAAYREKDWDRASAFVEAQIKLAHELSDKMIAIRELSRSLHARPAITATRFNDAGANDEKVAAKAIEQCDEAFRYLDGINTDNLEQGVKEVVARYYSLLKSIKCQIFRSTSRAAEAVPFVNEAIDYALKMSDSNPYAFETLLDAFGEGAMIYRGLPNKEYLHANVDNLVRRFRLLPTTERESFSGRAAGVLHNLGVPASVTAPSEREFNLLTEAEAMYSLAYSRFPIVTAEPYIRNLFVLFDTYRHRNKAKSLEYAGRAIELSKKHEAANDVSLEDASEITKIRRYIEFWITSKSQTNDGFSPAG